MERKETIGAAPEVLEAFPQEAEHLRELEERSPWSFTPPRSPWTRRTRVPGGPAVHRRQPGGGRPQGDVPDPDAHGADRRPGGLGGGVPGPAEKTRSSPYFARIDFEPDDGSEPGSYYIGLYAFRFQRELLVIDWRSPVASMFYDFELGPAHYDAPEVHGEGRSP